MLAGSIKPSECFAGERVPFGGGAGLLKPGLANVQKL